MKKTATEFVEENAVTLYRLFLSEIVSGFDSKHKFKHSTEPA
jgi:hypothetical protein